MAPKRTGGAQAPTAKKAKTVAPEAPVLDFIGKCDDIPKSCRQMLQAAVPICLEIVEGDRHKFQVEVLDRVAALLAGVESRKRGAASEGDGALAAINADKEKAAADAAAKKGVADAKQAECEEKGKIVDAAREVRDGAQKVLTDAQKAQADFNAKKAGLITEQESFNKLMTDVYEPLRDNTHSGNWRQRNKLISELVKKLSDLGAQDSLAEALGTTLKMTPDKREGTFAKATINFAGEYFNKHKATVAQDISALDTEESSHLTAVSGAESIVAEKKAALDVVEKEWSDIQDVWVGLENTSAEAARAHKQLEGQIPRAQKTIDKANADLEKFMEVPTLFAQLKEKSTVVPEEEPAEEPVEEEKQDAEEAAPAPEGEAEA